jgi:predicted dehydrogenase
MVLRIVQVGLGGWGKNWASHVVAQNKDVEAVAWVDMHEETLQGAQKSLDLPAERCFSSLKCALDAVEADAVLVTANLPGHVPSALEALNAGKHVLMEKPFAPTVAEARQIVETAAQHERIMMISQNYRYYAAPRVVAELIRKQVLGPVYAVNIDFRRYDNVDPKGANRHYTIWEPLLADMSIHHFDLMRMVLGQEPQEVTCKTWNPSLSKYDEPPTGTATITFNGGVVVSYRGSWVSTAPYTNWAGEWHMECERGEIIWTSRGELPEYVRVRPRGKRVRSIKMPDNPLTDRSGSLNAFVQAVQSGQEPETSGRDNLKTLSLMYATIESASSNRPVTLSAE